MTEFAQLAEASAEQINNGGAFGISGMFLGVLESMI